MNSLKFSILVLFFLASCTTQKASPEQGAGKADPLQDSGGTIEAADTEVFEFAPPDVKKIYETMLSAEKQSGETNSPDQVHSTTGVVTCNKDGSVTACYFRTEVKKADFLSLREKIERPTSELIWGFYLRVRPELKTESLIAGDLFCDFLGKNSPPFGVESVGCKIRHPRLINETMFSAALAENIAIILAEETPLQTGIVTVSGSILCQWIKGTERSPCVVRPIVNGILREKFIEVPAVLSAQIGPRLMQTLKYDISYRNDIKLEKVVLPHEIMGSVLCSVDSSKYKDLGRRNVACRIAI
jgi:hypothetical protein